MTPAELQAKLAELLLPAETEWAEFKEAETAITSTARQVFLGTEQRSKSQRRALAG